MLIILPNLEHSFISPVPVPVSDSGFRFSDFPYAPCGRRSIYFILKWTDRFSGSLFKIIFNYNVLLYI